ncbi:MAG: hypothetical protein CFH41_01617 [Alphaproteobacteria bacterium MarineAlpha11_Bin1]|nr:MAG: hypothetical protein CFH41_01617 [Alphaproteobacteria bacterium MarineAlpha11_Bin1]|tara:strand:+ start:1642 stop:2568 length:927 start_codon:yes stop_codon:yes gene_type:complete
MLIPLGAGVVSAVLHLSLTLGSPGALMIAYFAQLPIAATGLALGLSQAAVAAACAAMLVALLSPGAGTLSLFIITSALPVIMVIFFAMRNRADDMGGVAWYPVGRILVWLSMLAVAAFFASYVVFMDNEGGIRGAVQGYLKTIITGLNNTDQPVFDAMIMTMVTIFPGVAAASWILMSLINCVLAQRFLVVIGKNIRPKPVYSDIEAPLWPVAIIVIGALLTFSGGEIGFIGLNILLITSVPFFFIGLAVLHSISNAWSGRFFALAFMYIFLILAHWPAALIAVLGVLESRLQIRDRLKARRSNKGSE